MLLMVFGCASEWDVAGVVTSPRMGALTAVYETLGEENRVGVRTGTFEVQATCGSPVRVERQDGMLTFVSASQPAETGHLVFVLPAQAAGGFWLGLDRDVVARVHVHVEWPLRSAPETAKTRRAAGRASSEERRAGSEERAAKSE